MPIVVYASNFYSEDCDRKWTIKDAVDPLLCCIHEGVATVWAVFICAYVFPASLSTNSPGEKEPKKRQPNDKEEETEVHCRPARQLSDLIPRKGFQS